MNAQKKLSEIQKLVQEAIHHQQSSDELNFFILNKPPISIRERIKIYQEAYRVRMIESLRDDFSRVEAAIGYKNFNNLAHRFITETPSKCRNLAEYSEYFLEYILRYEPTFGKAATIDWISILSSQVAKPKNQLTLEQIQAGVPFKIKIMPSTFLREIQQDHIVVYNYSDEVYELDLCQKLISFLKFLESARSYDDITEFAEINQIDEEFVAKTVFEWIKNEVIYCQSLEEERCD